VERTNKFIFSYQKTMCTYIIVNTKSEISKKNGINRWCTWSCYKREKYEKMALYNNKRIWTLARKVTSFLFSENVFVL